MALFKRRRAAESDQDGAKVGRDAHTGQGARTGGDAQGDSAADTADADAQADPGESPDAAGDGPAASGPYDEAERPSLDGMVDFGAIRLPVVSGLKVSAGVAKATGRPVTLTVGKDGSQIELQAYAAPKTLGIWDEGIDDLEKSVTKQGGKASRQEGRFGAELVAEIPAKTAQGRVGKQVVRFIGVDGPRWLLRGAVTGKAARDLEAATALEDLFAGIVVARGDEARPPREALPLKLPGAPKAPGSEAAEGTEGASEDPTALLKRGPEITEVR
ncbi:MAG: DUF3710 domain-containing protein [Bifidobacteriaceae bacterium]|jgi:hypothetical protein|nr:DUF3710 domain-containing protein [Bifidobacteriaceae bacterium]